MSAATRKLQGRARPHDGRRSPMKEGARIKRTREEASRSGHGEVLVLAIIVPRLQPTVGWR